MASVAPLVYFDNPGEVPADYVFPSGLELRLESVYAEFDGSGASGAWLACLQILSSDNKVIGTYRPDQQLGVGDSAHVTWAPFLGRATTEAGFDISPNMGELGIVIGTTLSATQVMPIDYQDVEVGDQIMVLAFAPSVSAPAASSGFPDTISDPAGTTYNLQLEANWQRAPADPNTGVYYRIFLSDPVSQTLTHDVDSITVTWSNPVYDRNVLAWLIRYPGGVPYLVGLGGTASHDLAVLAQAYITQGASDFTPGAEKGFEWGFALIAYPSGAIGFGAHPPFTDYYMYDFRLIGGSKQQYFLQQFAYKSDVYTLAGPNYPTATNDIIGLTPAGTLIPANNSIGQNYSVGAGNWKGAQTIGFKP